MADQVIVDGIEVFEKTFSRYKDSFVIIGGTACRAMLSGGMYAPRRTEDIDMVLVLDRLDKDFIDTFWSFIKSGRYRCATRKDKDGQKKYVLYSFYDGLRYASVDSIIVLKVLAYLNLREDKRNGKHVNDVDFKKHRRDVVMAAASLGLGDSFPVGENIRQSITRFIEAVNGDPGVRQSISASLSLADESMLDNYLKVLDESFTAI